MRSLYLVLALCLCASTAQAQVEQGSFKVSLDTDVFSLASSVNEDSEIESKTSTQTYSFGPGGSAVDTGLPGYVALTLGYVAHPHLVPQLHLAFGRNSGTQVDSYEGEDDEFDLPSTTSLMFRPELEIPFNPDGRVVGYGLIGLDFRHIASSQEVEDEGGESYDIESTVSGYGPVLGGGLHFFVGSTASIDLGAQFSYLIFSQEVEFDGESVDSEADLSASMFSITAGLSLWP